MKNWGYQWPLLCLLASSGAAAAVPLASDATYRVPAANGSEGDARFPVQDLSFSTEKGVRHISFRLPEDLWGKKHATVTLDEKPSAVAAPIVIFSGDTPGEAATCVLGPKTIICLVHYRTNTATAAELKNFLSDKYKKTAAVERKLAIALAYQNEPAGILTFTIQ